MPQNLLLWFLVVFLLGLLAEWLLEIFFFRKDRANLSKLQAELDACSESRTTLDATVKARDTELSNLKAQAAKLQADLDAANKSQAAVDATLKARDAEVSDLKLKLSNTQSELDKTKASHSTLAADLAKFTAGAAASAATIKALEGDKSDLTTKVSRLQADLNAATEAKAASDKELADLKTQLAKANSELALANQTTTKLESDLQTCRRTSDEATAKYNALQADFERANAERTRLAQEADALKAKQMNVAAIPAPQPVTTLHKRSEDDETPFTTACPQHLSDVKGIGSVYETRLYEAGIGSYWELAHLSDDDFSRILQLTPLQLKHLNPKETRKDALRLAKETKSKGRKWTREAPDDLEPLEGIGATYEKRLYDAGICTYEALANATVELLEEICSAPAQFKPDYAAWIKQAKTLAAKKAKKPNG